MKKVVYKNYFSFVIALIGLLLLFCGFSIDRKERDFFTAPKTKEKLSGYAVFS